MDSGQEYLNRVQAQTDKIMARFLQVLPSNYVSQVSGPFYQLQFQAAAEQLARFMVSAQDVYADSDYDFTRPEFLWQILGCLVFPNSGREGLPDVGTDVDLRTFLRRMVIVLLQGATKTGLTDGLELLGDADITVIERYITEGIPEQFGFDVFAEVDGGTAFPPNPITYSQNVVRVLTALKPAHTLYDFRFLFRETLAPIFDDSMSWNMDQYYYEDLRRFCEGTRSITGTAGVILSGRGMLSDPTRSFGSVQLNSILAIGSVEYRVKEVLAIPVPNDTTARAYTTSPTGLSGTATVNGDVITDTSQDFGQAVEGEILTFSAGPNQGIGLRLESLLGNNGGLIPTTGPGDSVRISPSILRFTPKAPATGSGVSYVVGVDRLGVKSPREVTEDVTNQFWI